MKLIIAFLLLLLCVQTPAETYHPPSQYALGVDPGGAWRLNVNTGEMKRCYHDAPAAPVCVVAIQK